MKSVWILVAMLLLIAGALVGWTFMSSPSSSTTQPSTSMRLYIGGYSDAIYTVLMNTADGSLSAPTSAVKANHPSFLAQHPTLPMLYACYELSPDGIVASFKIEDGGGLAPRNSKSSAGNGPCHVSVDPQGRWLFAANYGDGKVAAFPLGKDGAIDRATFVEGGNGHSIVSGRQDGPHAHEFLADPTGRYALSTDLGTDEIIPYRLGDGAIKSLRAFNVKPGSGPRHLAFGRDGSHVYFCGELSNTLTTLAWDEQAGRLSEVDTRSTLPADFTGQSACAEVAMHPSGAFLYVSNRGHDSIAVFAIDRALRVPTLVTTVPCGGHEPRHMAVDPSGRFLVVANQKSDLLVSFSIDPATGIPKPTGSTAAVKAPSCVLFSDR